MQPGQPLRFQGVASRLEALRLVEHADVEVDPPHEARIGKADAAAAVRTERAVPAGAGGEGTRLLLGIGNLLDLVADQHGDRARSEEHTSELQSLMRISYAVFCLKKQITIHSDTCCTIDPTVPNQFLL